MYLTEHVAPVSCCRKSPRSRNQETQMYPQSHWKCSPHEKCKWRAGYKELIDSGTPMDILEGDEENTMISRINSELGITMKKTIGQKLCD